MCTAITLLTDGHYLGRTLDLDCSYGETVTVTPRNYPLTFRRTDKIRSHYAIIGMTAAEESYPLYYDAANECGLTAAGLRFPEARWLPEEDGWDNLAPFELIPWVLARCKSLDEARNLLKNTRLCNISFSDRWPVTPLHWIFADKTGAITVEPMETGLILHENPAGVLTNSPPFDYHMTRLCDYMNLSPLPPENRFGCEGLAPYSFGMGAMGLPGDLSSSSRFVRAAFARRHSVCEGGEGSVSQCFHILGTVAQTRGCVCLPGGGLEITVYTACIAADRGVYYYTTYENSRICAVDLHRCSPDSDTLMRFPLMRRPQILFQN